MKVNLIEEVIGREAFELLCSWAGGSDLDIPRNIDLSSGQKLAQAIGAHAARALIAWGAGGRVYVPYLYVMELQRRQRDVRALRAQGLTFREIARTYRYTGRYTDRQLIALCTVEIDSSTKGEALQAAQIPLF